MKSEFRFLKKNLSLQIYKKALNVNQLLKKTLKFFQISRIKILQN
jgi:hypothetical protein